MVVANRIESPNLSQMALRMCTFWQSLRWLQTMDELCRSEDVDIFTTPPDGFRHPGGCVVHTGCAGYPLQDEVVWQAS